MYKPKSNFHHLENVSIKLAKHSCVGSTSICCAISHRCIFCHTQIGIRKIAIICYLTGMVLKGYVLLTSMLTTKISDLHNLTGEADYFSLSFCLLLFAETFRSFFAEIFRLIVSVVFKLAVTAFISLYFQTF